MTKSFLKKRFKEISPNLNAITKEVYYVFNNAGPSRKSLYRLFGYNRSDKK
jgi:hypothetical protein